MKKNYLLIVALLAMLILAACSQVAEKSDATAPDASSNASAANDSSALPFSGNKSSENKGLFSRAEEPIVIASGTPLTVRLQTAVSSATSNAGDRFEAVLDSPLVVKEKTVAKAGAAITGRVVAVEHSGRLQTPGMIQLALTSIEIDGKSVPIETSSVIAKASSHKKRNLAWIGGSTAGGALIGGLAGGGKGALIGSAVGAGAGTGAAYATGKKDVGFGVERRLTFRTTEAIKVK